MTDAEIRAMPLLRTLAEPLEATQAFAGRLAMTHWAPATWRTYSIPIWYGLPALQEDLDRILAALDGEDDRGGAPVPVGQARAACHQAGRELSILRDRIDDAWTGRWQTAIGGGDQPRALPPLAEACNRLLGTLDRLLGTLDRLIASSGALSHEP